MLQIKFFFSYKKSLKQSTTRFVLSSISETTKLTSLQSLVLKNKWIENFFFANFFAVKEKRELINCLIKDMIYLIVMWRQIRGYPQGGNTTHTNANTSKKNKLFFNFRIEQFYKMFGQKKRNIYPTLIKAEYTNRLWWVTWREEWEQSKKFAIRMAERGFKAGMFNPVLLANNQTNGYIRSGKAAKMSKAKKLTKVYTLGVPLLFTRYIYNQNTPRGFPRILLKEEVNKGLGRKFYKRELRKK